MSRSRSLLTLAVATAALVCIHGLSAQAPFPSYTADQAPAELKPALTRAQAAARTLQATLQTRLVEVLPKAGPAGALDICRREAYAIAAEVGMQQGLSLGRTSHRVRNEKNAPKPWAAAIVAENATKKAAAVKTYVVDMGDQVGVLQPIGMGEACSLCHGIPSWMPDDVAATLKQAYPNDKATGFATGDLRGWIWAEVPKK
jgi:hypothetical protein